MDTKGKTFRIVEREYAYNSQLVQVNRVGICNAILNKFFRKTSRVKTINTWDNDYSGISTERKLKDTPIRTFWTHLFLIAFLGGFNWLLFFVSPSYIGYLIGLFFLFVMFLVIKQLGEKMISYYRYGNSFLILNDFPIKSGGILDANFQNDKVIKDFERLRYRLQFIEENKKETRKPNGEKERKILFKSWYSTGGELQLNYSGADLLLTLPSAFPGNTIYGNPLYYWVLDIEGENEKEKYSTVFFLPVS